MLWAAGGFCHVNVPQNVPCQEVGWDKLISGVPSVNLQLDEGHGKALTFGTLRDELKQRCMTHISDRDDDGCFKRASIIALLLCGDIQLNPGPVKNVANCGYCECACDWSMKAVCCDHCSIWFHKSCVSVSTQEYIRLGENEDEHWPCPRCRSVNVQSFTFMSFNVSTSNRYEVLDDSVFHSTMSSLPSIAAELDFEPGTASSPKSARQQQSTVSGRSASSLNSNGSAHLSVRNDKSSNLRVLLVNTNSARGKPAEIAGHLDYVQPDVLLLTETKLSAEVKSSEFLPQNYLPAYRKDRNLNGGGVLIAVRKGLIVDEVPLVGIDKSCELVCVRVSTSGSAPALYLLCYYRSQTDNVPNTSLDNLRSALEQVDRKVGNSKATVIVGGDFNCPKVDWDNLSIQPGNLIPKVCEKLIDVSTEFGLTQVQMEDTMGDSNLDLLFTNNPGLVTSTTVIPGVSTANEHNAVVADLKLRAQLAKKAPHKIHKWSDADFGKMKKETVSFVNAFVQRFGTRSDVDAVPLPSVSRLGRDTDSEDSDESECDGPTVSVLGVPDGTRHYEPDDPIFGARSPPTASQLGESPEEDVSDMWDAIDKHIRRIMRFVPSKMAKTRVDQPWITTTLKRFSRRCHRKFKKWKSLKHKGRPCKSARDEYFAAQDEKNKAFRKAKLDYVNNILQDSLNSNDSKPLFRHLKMQRTEDTGVAPLKRGGQVYSDPKEQASILADQFKSVFTVDSDENRDNTIEGPTVPPLPDLEITLKGVKLLLRGIDPKKAAGPDEVPCRILCTLSDELAPAFTMLFQRSYEHAVMPDVWSTAWITPVFKKGAKFDAANYRPVSLTCVPCKLLEHIIVSHMRGHIDRWSLVHPNQHGFTKKRHCESQLIMTTHDLLSRLDKKDMVDVAVLDFSKAFDTVPHRRLMNKLRLYGIEGKTHAWIDCFLRGRTQSVVVGGRRSHGPGATAGDPVISGVPQGTVLGPVLFLLYINDLPGVLSPGTVCRLYADDCLIYRSIHSIQDQLTLQADLASLHEWSAVWGLSFNVSKCSMLHIARQVENPCRFYTLGGEVIKSKGEADYLGVKLSNRYGTRASAWGPHIDGVVAKASQRLGFLKRSLRGSPYRLREMAFDALVRSALEYGGSIWDPTVDKEVDKVERIQNMGARWVRGSRGVVSITLLLKDLKWRSMADRRRNQRLCLFYKLLDGVIDVDISELSLVRYRDSNKRKTKAYHPDKLLPVTGKDRHSPLWTGTVVRTVADWNKLPPAALHQLSRKAGSLTTFKSQLGLCP